MLEAESGDKAMGVAESHGGQIDLLVTDVVMPRMRGPELARRIREVRPEVRVIYVSGYNEEGVTGLGALGGETFFLQKPFEAEELAATVREALEV